MLKIFKHRKKNMELIDLKTLSIKTSLSVRTLRQYIKRDRLPCHRPGKKYLINLEEFKSWFNRFKISTESQTVTPDKIFEETFK